MHTFSWRRLSCALLAAAALSVSGSAQRGGPAGPQQSTTPEPLKFRYMGPAASGRISTVAGVPGDPTTYYLGSASGGVWKSTDSGQTFVPIFDDQPVAAIGAIAVADSDPISTAAFESLADQAFMRDDTDRIAERDAISSAFQRVRPEDRALLVLHHVDGRSVAEIARMLAVPTGTAKWRLHQARRAFERAMEVEE